MILTGPGLDIAGAFASPSSVGADLFLINGSSVWTRDDSTGAFAWRVLATGVSATSNSQTTHDELGRIYAVTDDGRIAVWDGSAVSYLPFGLSSTPQFARVFYGPTTGRLYVAPSAGAAAFYEVPRSAGSGTVRALAPIPETHFTPTFCGDAMSGYIYAAGGDSGTTIWRYEIASDTWLPLPEPLPFDHGASGACTVSCDGWLYVTNNGMLMDRIQVR